jgi:hypothetical protein
MFVGNVIIWTVEIQIDEDLIKNWIKDAARDHLEGIWDSVAFNYALKNNLKFSTLNFTNSTATK